MILHLNDIEQPIVVFDIETTGLSFENDYIIQLAGIKIDPQENKIIDRYSTYINPKTNYTINFVAWYTHRITPDMLKDAPTIKEVAQDFINFIDGCVLCGYNCTGFDIPFIHSEFYRNGIVWNPLKYKVIDVYKNELKNYPHTLERVFLRYCGRTMQEAGLKSHDALSDCKATYAILRHQEQEDHVEYTDITIENDAIGYIDAENIDGKLERILAFKKGKYRNVPLEFVCYFDPAYIQYAMNSLASGPLSKKQLYEAFQKTMARIEDYKKIKGVGGN